MKKIFYLLIFIILIYGCGQVDKNHSFEKIIFYQESGCLNCSTFLLEIDSNKQIKLFAKQVFKDNDFIPSEEDTAKMGNFKGVVDDSTFTLLDKELKNIGLDSLEVDNINAFDASSLTLIIYYDNKRKVFETTSPPDKVRNLIRILYDIYKKSILTRTTQKIDIEDF